MSKSNTPAFISVNTLLTVCFSASVILFFVGLFLPGPDGLKYFLYAAGAMLACYDLVIDAVMHLLHDRRFDTKILLVISVAGAFAAGAALEVTAAVLLYKAGLLAKLLFTERYGYAVGSILDQRPEAASAVVDGAIARTPTGKLQVGDVVSVSPGERIALDGTVISGESEVDESLLTGAEQPRAVGQGSSVTGGAMNLTGVLNIRVSRTFDDANAAHVLKFVSNAPQIKSGPEKKLRRIARIYTPAVIGASVIVGLLVPLIGSLPLIPWLLRGLTLLLLANLDTAAAAVSMAHFSGIGGAAVKGIIFRGAAFADTLAHATSVIFSKTGILTTGSFEVADVNTYGMSPERLLMLAAYAEYNSDHPMARSVVRAANGIFDRFRIQNFREYPGLGVEAEVGGVSISAGSALLMGQLGITPDLSHTEQSVVYVAVNGKYAGRILLSDAVKPDAKKAVRDLHALGIDRIVMFTGDKKAAAAEIAGILGITEFYPECLPEDKVKRFRALTEMQLPGDRIVYVGDAAEDAPVLAAADIGIVLNGFGDKKELSDNSDRKDADIVILTGEVSKVPEAIMLARGTDAIVRRNLILTLGLRGLVLLLVLLGLAPIWAALLIETVAGILALFYGTRAAGFRRGTMRKALTGSKTRAARNDQN